MIGKEIYNARKLQGLSQEELAQQSRVSVRTLQRIENDVTTPRSATLKLICDVLHLNPKEVVQVDISDRPEEYGATAIKVVFLILLNLVIMSVIGYMTWDSEANFNSKFGAILLGFFISYFIVTKTAQQTGTVRLIRYGSGLTLYLVLGTIAHPFPPDLLLGFYPAIVMSLSVLFFGKHLVASK